MKRTVIIFWLVWILCGVVSYQIQKAAVIHRFGPDRLAMGKPAWNNRDRLVYAAMSALGPLSFGAVIYSLTILYDAPSREWMEREARW